MVRRVRRLTCAALVALLAPSCAMLGLKSKPWPTNVEIHNSAAVNFLRSAPRTGEVLGDGLRAKAPLADGRLIGLAVSGGGARAAAFTLGILSELQSLEGPGQKNALEQIDFISSNSGGSWGVAAYLSDRVAMNATAYSLRNRQSDLINRFEQASKGRVSCWASRFNEHVTRRATYADIYSPGNPEPLPAAFLNASLMPAQAPFVFSDDYLRHYEVTSFNACGKAFGQPAGGLASVPLGFAAATSGSVPGFYNSYADTGLCTGRARAASFCHQALGKGRRGWLYLVDGGLYDNIGYKTAFEIFRSHKDRAAAKKSMIIVNSGYETGLQTVPAKKARGSFATKVLTDMGFPAQDETFSRLHEPLFSSVGADAVVLLDFFSTANFTRDDVRHLDGLEALAAYAATNVMCYETAGLAIKAKRTYVDIAAPPSVDDSVRTLERKGGDCLAANFYRAGTLAKTTYLTDKDYFTFLWQLGQLSVRMNEAKIKAAFY